MQFLAQLPSKTFKKILASGLRHQRPWGPWPLLVFSWGLVGIFQGVSAWIASQGFLLASMCRSTLWPGSHLGPGLGTSLSFCYNPHPGLAEAVHPHCLTAGSPHV